MFPRLELEFRVLLRSHQSLQQHRGIRDLRKLVIKTRPVNRVNRASGKVLTLMIALSKCGDCVSVWQGIFHFFIVKAVPPP